MKNIETKTYIYNIDQFDLVEYGLLHESLVADGWKMSPIQSFPADRQVPAQMVVEYTRERRLSQ